MEISTFSSRIACMVTPAAVIPAGHEDNPLSNQTERRTNVVMSKAKPKTNINFKELVLLFQELGCHVTETRSLGKGFPNLLISGWGQSALVETTPDNDPDDEKMFFQADFLGRFETVTTAAEAINLAESFYLNSAQHLSFAPVALAVTRERYGLEDT